MDMGSVSVRFLNHFKLFPSANETTLFFDWEKFSTFEIQNAEPKKSKTLKNFRLKESIRQSSNNVCSQSLNSCFGIQFAEMRKNNKPKMYKV